MNLLQVGRTRSPRRQLALIGPMVAALAVVAALAGNASAALTLNFSRLSSNASVDVAGQLSVRVLGYGDNSEIGTYNDVDSIDADNQVLFVFKNNVGIASSITDVYFDDGTLLGISKIYSSTGVSFSNPATPEELPGRNNVNPSFETTAGFSADSNTPVSQMGVDAATEWVAILFDLKTINGVQQGYQSVIDALVAGGVDGGLRVGLRVQSIGAEGDSDGFINGPPNTVNAVPEPSTLAVALIAGIPLGIAGLRRHRRRSQVEA